MNATEILYQAAGLKRQMKTYEDEYNMMLPAIKDAVKELATDEKMAVNVSNLGQFVVSPFRKYTYSAAIKEMTEHLDKLKKEEQATGVAQLEETEIVRFVIKKDD